MYTARALLTLSMRHQKPNKTFHKRFERLSPRGFKSEDLSNATLGNDFNALPFGSMIFQGPTMPRYFFHVRDGETTIDREGLVLASATEARAQAVSMMGEILRDEGRTHEAANSWHVHVMDDDSDTVCRLYFASDSDPTGRTTPFADIRLKKH